MKSFVIKTGVSRDSSTHLENKKQISGFLDMY